MELTIEDALIKFRKDGYKYLAVMTSYNEPMNYLTTIDCFIVNYYANKQEFIKKNYNKFTKFQNIEDNCFVVDDSDFIYTKSNPDKIIILFLKSEPKNMEELDNIFKDIKEKIKNLVSVT